MKDKYNELIQILKENNLKIEKNEFKIVNKLIYKKSYENSFYEDYFSLSEKAQCVVDAFQFGELNDDNSQYYLVKKLNHKNIDSPHCDRTFYIAKNRSQLLYIFLNKTNGSTQTRIMQYAFDEIEI